MAVKQNNTEGNGSSADANQVNGGNGVKSTGTITKSKKINSNSTNGDSGGGVLAVGASLGSGGNAELPGCSGNTGAKSKTKFISPTSNIGIGTPNVESHNNLANILNMIDYFEINQQRVYLTNEMLLINRFIINNLAQVQNPGKNPETIKRFKEDMEKIGLFLSKSTEKSKLVYTYLDAVWKLINMTDGEAPSYALAIIFQLFKPNMIQEAVHSLLKHNLGEENIRRTVGLLCDWLRICNFCQNLHLWIKVILNGLQEQKENALVEQIALENIECLFSSLLMPAFRLKVAPVVFQMLSSIEQNPDVFQKISPQFQYVISSLKKQANGSGESAESTKKVLQQLVDQTRQLIARFYHYEDLYKPIELALKGLQSSNDYMYYVSDSKSFDSPTQIANAKVGLVNLGNTCYMNSVLQALAMTKEFSREILLLESKSPLLIKMQQQIAFMLYSARQELTPSKVLNATRPPGFSPGLQQDSSEFLGYLLETLHEQEMAFPKKISITFEQIDKKESLNKDINIAESTQDTRASALYKDDEEENVECECEGEGEENNLNDISTTADSIKSTNLETNKNNSFSSSTTTLSGNNVSSSTSLATNSQLTTIEKTFTGKLATTYKCITCGWKSCNIDSFRDLQLSFPDVKNDCASNYSIQDLIEYYCSSEKLYGDNQYFCERCKKLSDAERYINVISAPKNLILTLKHFKYDQKYHMRAKLMHKVFHDEKVSLKVCAPESLEEIATVHYDLYAGVVHSGFSMDSGHYYTYAADASNKWYKFNDSIVTPSKTEELHNLTPPNTPYILFYQMGARSNETPETSASTKVIKVDVPTPLTLEELPHNLRDMVVSDNYAFNEELKMRSFKNANSLNANAMKIKEKQRDSFDDDDDEQPPPVSGCGGNAIIINVNRFVY